MTVVNIRKIPILEKKKIAVIILKFDKTGFTIE